MSLEDRDWTLFALEAEVEAHGLSRVVKVHNALREELKEIERLRHFVRGLNDGYNDGALL